MELDFDRAGIELKDGGVWLCLRVKSSFNARRFVSSIDVYKRQIYQGGQKVGDSQKAERPEDSILLHDHAGRIHRNEKGRL